jgi:hypothetical protein
MTRGTGHRAQGAEHRARGVYKTNLGVGGGFPGKTARLQDCKTACR